MLGLGTLLAKAAVKGAYRLVSVHPDDRYLLGMEWVGVHYVQYHATLCPALGTTNKTPELMHLLRCIFFIEASLGFSLSVRHTSGVAND